MSKTPPPGSGETAGLDELPDFAALLAAERARVELSDAAVARVHARLETSLQLPPPRRLWPSLLGAFAGGLLVGAALCGALLGGRLAAVRPLVLVLDAPPSAPPQVVVVREAMAPAVTPPAVREPVRAANPHEERSHPIPADAPVAADDRDTELSRERALIETARTALSRKQPEVLELLQRHAQDFPSGRLAEERESLLVQALVQAGRGEEARRRGVAFRTRWPQSLLLPVIDAALREIP